MNTFRGAVRWVLVDVALLVYLRWKAGLGLEVLLHRPWELWPFSWTS